MPIAPGTRLGPYVVQEFIGQGAMGVVFRAYHSQLERTGAVKVLQGLAPDADSTARFRREAQAIAHMRHPNILNVFDFGEYDGTPYMIVEYVEGGSLSVRVKSGTMDRATALHYLRGIGDALDYAHSLGIVHRDVKPANVLLGPGKTPILADFGLVKLMQSASVKSMTGVTTGTPAYMAPEQVTGSHVGPAADRYSLAVIAYEMLTGSFPFDDGGVLEVLYAHVHREPPAPSSRNPKLSPRVDAVILRGLAKKPEDRWETCGAFVAALDAALNNASPSVERTVVFAPPRPSSSVMAGVAPTALAAAAAVVADPRPAITLQGPPADAAPPPAPVLMSAPPAPPRRQRTRYVIGAVLLILVLLVAAIFFYDATRPPTLSLSPDTVAAGDHVVVSATNVPHNQAGDIEALGVARSFTADSRGNVNIGVEVPLSVRPGDYVVSICWSGSCPAQAILHVTAPVAIATPTPSSASSPSSSPSSSPVSSPTPLQPEFAVSPSGSLRPGAAVSVQGLHFTPGRYVTIYFAESAVTKMGVLLVQSNGAFSGRLNLPGSSTARPGKAAIEACDYLARCVFTVITIS